MANSKSSRKSTRKATQRNGASAWADFEKFAATIEDEEVASSGALSLMAWIASLWKRVRARRLARVDAEIRYLDPLRGVDDSVLGRRQYGPPGYSQRARQVLRAPDER